ncbi:MAG: hypothetical protein K1W18_07010 [Oscillospiraceae bacterium]
MRNISNAECKKVLRVMCEMAQNLFDVSVFTSQEIAIQAEMPRCKVLKIIHELRDDGFVERASQGCPAIETYGEVVELLCDAAPPRNGWSLTEKARESAAYKAAVEEFDRSLEEWAKGLCKEDKNKDE